MGTVRFDCFRAQVQPFGDIAHVMSFADQLQNFQFAIAQSIDWRTRIVVAMNVIVDHPIRHHRANEYFSLKDRPHRDDKLIERLTFHHVPPCTGSQRSFGVKRFVVH